jgi:hypothetical protein
MKRLFTELLKLAVFIGLVVAAAYFTGNWDNLVKIGLTAKSNVEEAFDFVVKTANGMIK